MPYSSWHFNREFIENCPDIDSNREYYYPRKWFYGPIHGFSETAEWILRFFIKPMDDEDHRKLQLNMDKGSGIDSLLEIGRIKGDLLIFKFILLFSSLISILMVAIGLFKKFSKKANVPIQHDLKVRTRMFPLWLVNVPLVALTILMAILFSIALWPSYEARFRESDSSAMQRFDYLKSMLIPGGSCEFEGKIVKGNQNIKRLLASSSQNMTQCDGEKQIYEYEKLVRNDEESIDEMIESAENILLELEEITKKDYLGKSLDHTELLYANVTIRKTLKEMQDIKKQLDKTYVVAEDVLAKLLERKKEYGNRMNQLMEPLLDQLDKDEVSYRRLIDSLNNAVTKIFDNFYKSSQRMSTVWTEIRSTEDSLNKYIFAQAVVAISVLLAISAMSLGFLGFGVGLAYPPSINYCPKLIKYIRLYMTLVFVLLGALSVVIFFYSASALGFAAPATSVCNTLYNNFKEKGDPGQAYYNNFMIYLNDFEGEQLNNFTIAQFMMRTDGSPLASQMGNGIRDLLPVRRPNFVAEFLQKLKKEESTGPKIAYQMEHFGRISSTALEEINFTETVKETKSPLVGLVAKEIRTFTRMVKELSISSSSFDEIDLTGCEIIRINDAVKDELKRSYYISFDTFKDRLMHDLYKAYLLIDPYVGSGADFCVQFRVPISGVWFGALLLGIVLMMDMVIIYKISNRLVVKEYINFVNEAYESSTSPLVEPKTISSITDI